MERLVNIKWHIGSSELSNFREKLQLHIQILVLIRVEARSHRCTFLVNLITMGIKRQVIITY